MELSDRTSRILLKYCAKPENKHTQMGPFESNGNKIRGPFYEDEYDAPRLSLSNVAMPSGMHISINAPISWKLDKWYDSIFDIQKNGKGSRVQLNSTCMCPENKIGENLKKIPVELGSQGGRERDLIANEMHRTLGAHSVKSYRIAKVEKIVNCCLWERYREKVRQIDSECGVINERILFHGTSAAEDIVKTGFDVQRANPNGMFGPGIYFAQHSSKSNQYAAGYLGGVGHKKMLLCRVALGKTYRLTESEKMTKPPPGHHSVTGVPTVDGLRYPEFIIYTDHQAYPEYLVSYDVQE